jgi:hypothetical protein
MAVYQCLFFSAGVIEYWENLECESHGAGLASLAAKISEGDGMPPSFGAVTS